MGKFTIDILDIIVDELCCLHDGNVKNLTRYATISRQWQHMIEARAFKCCKLRTYPGELERFGEIYAENTHRREVLRKIRFTCNIPHNGHTAEQNQQNQDKFFSDISTLFSILTGWESDQSDASLRPLHLRIRCCLDPAVNRKNPMMDRHRPMVAPSIRMEDFSRLPSVRRINSADIHHSKCYTVHPHTSGRLLCLMPRLENAAVYFWDPDFPPENRQTRRRAIRRAMADCILMIKNGLPGLKSLYVDRWGWHDPPNHFYQPESLMENDVDTLCQAIRSLSSLRHLEELKLIDILLSQDLFPEPSGEPRHSTEENSWPSLKCLEISTECIAANGQWYYSGVPDFSTDLDSDESIPSNATLGITIHGEIIVDPRYRRLARFERFPEVHWRSHPNPTTFTPFIRGLAEMSLQMPKLELGFFKIRTEPSLAKSLTFQWVSEWQPFEKLNDEEHGVEYIGNSQSRQWRITPENRSAIWQPDDDVREALEAWSGKGNIIIDCPMAE